MKRYLIAAAVCICVAGCGDKKVANTAHLPQDKMEAVLVDLHLAEVYSSMVSDSLHESRSKDMDSLAVYYKDVFAHHNITREQFEESFEWYRTHPGTLDSSYKQMTITVGRLAGLDTTVSQ
jgi:hypothetical protein